MAYSSEATHVFPLHPLADDLAATSTPGIWLLGESEVILFPIIAAHGELPPGGSCPCGSRTTGSCIRSDLSGAVVARWAVDDAPATRPRLDLGDVGSCRCFFEWEGDDAVGDAIATDGDARSLGLCPGPSMAPVSVFGGVLYVSGGTNTLECTGFNIYDLVVDRLPLLGEAPSYAWSGDPLCHPETYFPTDLEALREPCPPVPPAATEDDDDWDSEGRCDICPQGADGEVLVSRSGRIYEVGLATVNTGGDVLFLRSVELTPERCPSPADPCGSAEGFPGLDGADAWWVATDGSAALELRAGQVSVRLRGEPEARGAAPMSETIIGVRFHADVRALLARLAGAPQGNELIALVLDALGTEGPGTDLPPTCNAAAECPTGQQCRASQCVPPCEHDEDCPGSGLCDHVCGADRFCEPRCYEVEDCGPGLLCDDGHCLVAETVIASWEQVALAAEDTGFADTGGGRGWGERCFAHLRAHRLEPARAACLRGLDVARDPSVRGALLYNLGRVYEEGEEPHVARRLYERSLEARPGNQAVHERLEALPHE